jgi:hypothetical protein
MEAMLGFRYTVWTLASSWAGTQTGILGRYYHRAYKSSGSMTGPSSPKCLWAVDELWG